MRSQAILLVMLALIAAATFPALRPLLAAMLIVLGVLCLVPGFVQ